MNILRAILTVGLLLPALCLQAGFARNEPRSMKVIQQLQHREFLHGVAWSPSGARLATLSNFGQTITIWDAKTWKREREITQYSGGYVGTSIVFVTDDHILASSAARSADENIYSLNLWDATTGVLIKRIAGPPIPPGGRRSNQAGIFVLSKSGSLLAMSFSHTSDRIVIFRASDWSIAAVLQVPPSPSSVGNASAIAFSPNERAIAIANGRHLQLIDIRDNSIGFSALAYAKFGLLAGPVIADLKYSPDGSCFVTAPSFFSSQDSGAVRIWDSRDAKLITKFADTPSSIRMVDWNPDGTMLAAADEGNFGKIWIVDANDKRTKLIFQFPVEIAGAISFAPDGKLAATSGKTLLILN